LSIKSLSGNGINLINEDDGRGVLFGQTEHITHHAGTFTKILLHKLGANYTDEGGSGVVSHSLGQHGLAASRGSVHEDATWWVNTNLLVEVKVGERQFNGLSDLLFLNVHASDVSVADVWFLICLQHGDAAVSLRRENVHQSIAVLVKGNTGTRLQQLSINSRQNAYIVVGLWRREKKA
jgi:hypothetical protein